MQQNSEISWTLRHFDALTLHELYDILQLRTAVFIVEQNCAYQDLDGKDRFGYHLLGHRAGVLIAYSRLLPAGVSYNDVAIGRVVTRKEARMTGAGKELMHHSIAHCAALFGSTDIRIGAQKYLRRFYETFGFADVGHEYLEDGIPHIEMVRKRLAAADG